jgi:hypothetical protein
MSIHWEPFSLSLAYHIGVSVMPPSGQSAALNLIQQYPCYARGVIDCLLHLLTHP